MSPVDFQTPVREACDQLPLPRVDRPQASFGFYPERMVRVPAMPRRRRPHPMVCWGVRLIGVSMMLLLAGGGLMTLMSDRPVRLHPASAQVLGEEVMKVDAQLQPMTAEEEAAIDDDWVRVQVTEAEAEWNSFGDDWEL